MATPRRARLQLLFVLAAYVAISTAYAWPLPLHLGSTFVPDSGDPSLTATIMWWNATHVPFTEAWWNGLHYYPTAGVTALTENLVGIAPFTSPFYWLTGDTVTTYNLAFLVTWPFNAFAAFLLARKICRRDDLAFMAGLAFAFSPYRAGAALGHIHTLSSFWLPLCLLAMHGYLLDGRRQWLALFGIAWVLQSLANGHYMLFGALLLAGWLAWFCSTAGTWRRGLAIAGAWVVASLPLVPIFYTYLVVHGRLGLERTLNEIMAFSARLESWTQVSAAVWLWSRWLAPGADNLFPGLTALAIVLLAVAIGVWKWDAPTPATGVRRRGVRLALGAVAAVSLLSIAVSLYAGKWTATLAGVTIRMGSLDRALLLLMLTAIPLAWTSPGLRDAVRRRSAFLFYTAMVAAIAIFCFGPVVHGDGDALFSSTPYSWLMHLPGYRGLRVPTRFWMLALLCLAVACSLAAARLAGARPALRTAIVVLGSCGILLEGWLARLPMDRVVESWATVEASERREPILELPAGDGDYHATYRTTTHGRRLFNGVSGYNPPHYIALLDGLRRRDSAMLQALASLTAFDIVIDRRADPDGALVAYASAAAGATRGADDGARLVVHVPKGPPEGTPGPSIPIRTVDAVRSQGEAALMIDGRIDTGWGDFPQVPDQWVRVDLGEVHEVAAVSQALGDFLLDFPKQLTIDVSADGATWERAWEGFGAAPAVLGYIRAPREGVLRLPFARTHRARYLILRQHEAHRSMWRISELQVHAPATSSSR